MLLKVSGYILGLIFLLSLPDRLFSFLFNLKAKFPSLPIKSENREGNQLIITLNEYETSFSFGQVGEKKVLPQFKFYTKLFERLLEANRQNGVGIKKLIPELKLGLQKDLQFEKKLNGELLGGHFQFLVIFLVTWGFIFFSKTLVEIKLDFWLAILILFLQITGFLLFFSLSKLLKKKLFSPFSNAFFELYLFYALLEVRLPVNSILHESNILNGTLLSLKRFSFMSSRVQYSVERWKATGISPKEETEGLIQELWYSLEEEFLNFIKKVQILKFTLMALLFLPAYFLYLASIFKFFMEQ